MKREQVVVKSGKDVGLLGLLFIALVVLKLCNVIKWSWWWVTAPLWGPLAIGLIVVAGIILWCQISALFHKKKTEDDK